MYYSPVTLIMSHLLTLVKGIVPKNVNSVIIYSPPRCSKPEGISFFCWTQK